MPHLPSIERWRQGNRAQPYDPNVDATRQEMRSFVCGQCHVEYYCGPKTTLFFPWDNGLKVEQIETHYDELQVPRRAALLRLEARRDRGRGAEGAASGVRDVEPGHPRALGRGLRRLPHALQARRGDEGLGSLGAQPAAEHLPRVPGVPSVSRKPRSRRASTRSRTARTALMQRSAGAMVDMLDAIAARARRGATSEQLAPALELQRKAQWRLDFVAAENSMGFHAPAEAARILGRVDRLFAAGAARGSGAFGEQASLSKRITGMRCVRVVPRQCPISLKLKPCPVPRKATGQGLIFLRTTLEVQAKLRLELAVLCGLCSRSGDQAEVVVVDARMSGFAGSG